MGYLKNFWRLILLLAVVLGTAHGQGSVTGTEQTITYTGTNATLAAPNTPATNFALGGANTFIVPVAPTVSIRIYITNNTANACSNFSIQMFSATDPQTNSFNNALTNWQVIPLQSASGALVNIVSPLTIPASGAVYVSSTAIAAPKVAIQIVQTAACATTSVEVTAVVTAVSVVSPLVTTVSNSQTTFTGNNVQGISPTGGASSQIYPVLVSGAGPPTNGNFLQTGIDTFNPMSELSGLAGTGGLHTLGRIPTPTQSVPETAVIIWSGNSGTCGSFSYPAGWVQLGSNSIGMNVNTFFPSVGGQAFTQSLTGGCTYTGSAQLSTVINFNSTGVKALQSQGVAFGAVGLLAGNNCAGCAVVVGANCTGAAACGISSITDTLGMSWKQLTALQDPGIGGGFASALTVWVNTSANPGGADTITPVAIGAPAGLTLFTMNAVTPASLVQQQIPLETDTLGAQVIRQDALGSNQVTCNVTLSTNTTTQLANCSQATTVNGVAVRFYITDIQLNTTTAGTATTVSLVTGTGTNCGTGTTSLTAMNYPNTVVGIQNIVGYRTPLVTPLQTAVCAIQAGTTAGTTVVEVHGFLAP